MIRVKINIEFRKENTNCNEYNGSMEFFISNDNDSFPYDEYMADINNNIQKRVNALKQNLSYEQFAEIENKKFEERQVEFRKSLGE